MSNTNYPRGKELVALAVNKIIEDPACHKQSEWHCDTQHCIGGLIQILGGKPETNDVIIDVLELTGMERSDVRWMCEANRSIAEIYGIAKDFLEDRAGFDRDGRDRDGRDRDGLDRAGFDCAGLDRAGFDCDGRDRDGNKLPFLVVPTPSGEGGSND